MSTDPGIARVSSSMTSTRPTRCSSAATFAARFGTAPSWMARSLAVPKPRFFGVGLFVATAAATKIAPTATMISASTRSCWRHSRRKSRHAHLITTRRATSAPGPAPSGLSAVSYTVVMAAVRAAVVLLRSAGGRSGRRYDRRGGTRRGPPTRRAGRHGSRPRRRRLSCKRQEASS